MKQHLSTNLSTNVVDSRNLPVMNRGQVGYQRLADRLLQAPLTEPRA